MFPIKNLKQFLVNAKRSSDGSITIESTLIMPMIMICLFTLLFLSVFVYEKVYLLYASQLTTERVAYGWDNSSKNIESGSYAPGQSDGLYWRITQDQITDMLSVFKANTNKEDHSKLMIPLSSSNQKYSLSLTKMKNGIDHLPSRSMGEMAYDNFGFERKVVLQLDRPFALPSFISKQFTFHNSDVQSQSWVVDPVEFIRTIDLLRTYIPLVKDKITPARAQSLLVEPTNQSNDNEIVIKSEKKASEYLRMIVSGESTKIPTSVGVREVDALDGDSIAHYAFYTYREDNLLGEQLPKDLVLLEERKQVKGVVWHFFRQKGKSKIEFSSKFWKQIKDSGVVVVLHE